MRWQSRLINGDISVGDKLFSGGLSRNQTVRTEGNVEEIQELVSTDRQVTIEQFSEISEISCISIQRILINNFLIKRVAT